MSLTELLELAEKLEDRINTYWNFYTIVVLAVTGWMFSADTNFDAFPSLVAAIALGGFFLSNISVIHFATQKLAALESEIEAVASGAGFKSEKYIQQLRTWSIPNRVKFSWALHLVVDFAVLAAIFIVHR